MPAQTRSQAHGRSPIQAYCDCRVESPDCQHVELALTGIREQAVQGGAAGEGATDSVIDIFVHDGQLPLLG